MRASIKSAIALSLATLTIGLGLTAASAPAQARPIRPPGNHFPHHGFGGFGLAVIGGDSGDACGQRVYDRYGNYLGVACVNQ